MLLNGPSYPRARRHKAGPLGIWSRLKLES